MKQITTLFVALSCLLACSKADPDAGTPARQILGTWRLASYCQSTGTASCTPVTVPADKGVFVTFTADGYVDERYQNIRYEGYGFVGCPGSYRFEGNDLRFYPVCSSSSNGVLLKNVAVSQSQLMVGSYVFFR